MLQRKWPIWGKLLLKNKMRAEVTSYRLAINEAWESLEGTVPSDQLHAMREAERELSRVRPRRLDPAGSGADDTECGDPETSPTEIERATARGSTLAVRKIQRRRRFVLAAISSARRRRRTKPPPPPVAETATTWPRAALWSWNAGRATVTSGGVHDARA